METTGAWIPGPAHARPPFHPTPARSAPRPPALQDNAALAQELQAGQYGAAAATGADMLEHRALQAGEELAAATRAVLGGSSVKPGDSADPSFLHAGTQTSPGMGQK